MVVVEVLLVFADPFTIRKLPGVSVIPEAVRWSAAQLSVAEVAAPVSSLSTRPEPLELAALFQLVLATTPALSELPIEVTPLPTKLMLIAGTDVGAGVALAWLEFPLSPAELSAVTT